MFDSQKYPRRPPGQDDDGDVVCGGFGYMLDAVIVLGMLSD